jgi:hypothetical protein
VLDHIGVKVIAGTTTHLLTEISLKGRLKGAYSIAPPADSVGMRCDREGLRPGRAFDRGSRRAALWLRKRSIGERQFAALHAHRRLMKRA